MGIRCSGDAHYQAGTLQYTAESWQLSVRQTDSYIAQARQLLREQTKVDAADSLARHKAIRRDLLRPALNSGSNRLKLDIMRDEAKLLGLRSPDTLVIRGDLNIECATLEDDANHPPVNISQYEWATVGRSPLHFHQICGLAVLQNKTIVALRRAKYICEATIDLGKIILLCQHERTETRSFETRYG